MSQDMLITTPPYSFERPHGWGLQTNKTESLLKIFRTGYGAIVTMYDELSSRAMRIVTRVRIAYTKTPGENG